MDDPPAELMITPPTPFIRGDPSCSQVITETGTESEIQERDMVPVMKTMLEAGLLDAILGISAEKDMT